jgi:deoxyhypusine monooxygenase
LKQFLNDQVREVRETCELSIKRIEDFNRKECISGEFQSVDPIPPFQKKTTNEELSKIFLDENESLTEKYRAMFSLRNKVQEENDLDALAILCKGFSKKEGALFKHEVAFVLGQLEKEESSDTLHAILKDENEHPMVRFVSFLI